MTINALSRLALAALVGAGAGSLLVAEGQDRSDRSGTFYTLLGAGLLLCAAALAAALLRTLWQQRGLSAEERAAAHEERTEQARARRPAWLDSTGYGIFMLAAGAYWTYLLVRALDRGAYGIAALDALFLVVAVTAVLRIVRSRRRDADS